MAPIVPSRPSPADGPVSDTLPSRDATVGDDLLVRRLLPNRRRRLVGPWCFLDHFGPARLGSGGGMRVAQHPHIGLQTVTWLFEGTVRHKDSLGSLQDIRPGELNLMTAGHGIAHTEESPPDAPPGIHGVQLWIALPDPAREGPAAFAHHADLPRVRHGDADVTVFLGRLGDVESPAVVHSPLVGAEIHLDAGGEARIPTATAWEHAVVVVDGTLSVEGEPLAPGALRYLGTDRASLRLEAEAGARAVLVGGAPLEDAVVVWWNFVGRSWADVAAAHADWAAGERFGPVPGFDGGRLEAPSLPG